MNDPDSFLSVYDRYRQARAGLSDGNKTAVFEALATAGITQVLVEFDGMGDSGQIESVTAFRGEEKLDLPSATVSLQRLSWGNTEPSSERQGLEQAVESLCYDYLEERHGGWENNDGAYGEFRLDVVARTVELEFNGRFTDVFTENHTF